MVVGHNVVLKATSGPQHKKRWEPHDPLPKFKTIYCNFFRFCMSGGSSN